MKNPWIVPTIALVTGALGGYFSGKISAPEAASAAAERIAPQARSASRSGSASEAEGKKKSRPTSTEQIARLPGISSRTQALLDFYAGLTPEQLAEEATKLESLPMGERIMASFLLFGRWAEVDPTSAMAFSNGMGMAGGFVRPTILKSWASVDPVNAAKYYAENPREFDTMDLMGGRGPGGGQGASSIIAAEWARQDPAAALAWAGTLQVGKTEAMSAVVSEVAKTDPLKAAALVNQIPAAERTAAYRSIAAAYGEKDFSAAQAWVRTLPTADQSAALASAIGGLSNQNPQEAAKQTNAMAEGEAKDRAVSIVVKDLARLDPKVAGDFLKTQKSEVAQIEAMDDLIPVWTAKNASGALAYVNSFAAGPVRDSGTSRYVRSDKTSSPASLIKLAESITDEDTRNRSVSITAMRWMREDAPAAKAYIAGSSLSDAAKQRLTEGGGGFGGRGFGGGQRER